MGDPQTLKNINECSRLLLNRLGHHPTASRSSRLLDVSLPHALPLPPAINPHLAHVGWSSTAAEHLSKTYMQHATALKIEYERNMKKAIEACINAGPSMGIAAEVSAIYSTYLSTYKRALHQWADVGALLSKKNTSMVGDQHDFSSHAPVIPQRAVSELEQAFIHNPYPTRVDKITLAKRFRIGYKQVNIWFQNKRTRSKRSGKDLRKAAFVSYSDPPFVESDLEPWHAPLSCGQSHASTPTTKSSLSVRPCPFQARPAPHAFPAPYPPLCEHDPFSSRGSGVAFELDWPKETTHSRSQSEILVDTDALVLRLENLSLEDIREGPVSPLTRPAVVSPRLYTTAAPCFPTLVLPPSAPLPALLCPMVATWTRKSGETHVSCSHPQQSIGSAHSPVSSLIPSRASSLFSSYNSLKEQSSSPLRRPTSLPRLSRDFSHPYKPPSRKHGRLARLSSSSSLSSICSDTSSLSSGSSHSSFDSPLNTPTQLCIDIPPSIKAFSAGPASAYDPVSGLGGLDHLSSLPHITPYSIVR